MELKTSSIIATVIGVLALSVAVYSEQVVKKPDRKDGRIVVTYWEKWTNFEADAMRDVVNAFNKKQDKIFVEYLSVSGISDKTIQSVSGGIPPDIAGLFGPNTAQYAFNNAVMPLDELCRENGITPDQYIKVYWDMCNYKGTLYALPTMPASTALHYNAKMLADAGLDPAKPPQTFEELDAMDEKVAVIKGKSIEKMGFLPSEPGWWNWSWPYYFGGNLWNGKDKITMTSPEVIRAYTWMANYAKKYGPSTVTAYKQGFGGFDSPQNAFIDGKIASVNQGVWMNNFIRKYNPKMDWRAVPFPHPADRPDLADGTVIDLDILVIPRGAKHPKEAFEFIKFVQSNEGMELLAKGQKKHTPLIHVTPGFFESVDNPYIELFAKLPRGKNAFSPPQTPIWPQWSSEINSAVEKINLGEDVTKSLQAVQDKMQPLLDRTLEIERARGIGVEKPTQGERP